MFEFTVIVPVYNEELNLKRVEKELLSFINNMVVSFLAIFINDSNSFSTRFKFNSSLYTGTIMVNSNIF